MNRIHLLVMVVVFLSGYAWRDWFKALVAAVVLFAFLEHRDMPRAIAGIPGLNLWNLLFLSIAFAWLKQRQEEGNVLEFPRGVRIALVLYLAVVAIAFLRAFLDPGPFYNGSRMDLALNYLVNPLKFLLPALMLYDGCRSRERVFQAVSAILLVYFFLAILSVKSMGLHFDLSSGDDLSSRAARRLVRDVGYHRVDLSMMLAGASWAVVAYARYFSQWWIKLSLFGAAGVIVLGQAVTGGRTGYATWGLIGLFLCVVKWRKFLPVIPLAIGVVIAFVPAVRDRMLQGFAQKEGGFVEQTDASEITSGRSRIWPLVIEEIGESPIIGHGRIAMQRQGVSQRCVEEYGEVFGHPHNAYLELLLDNGLVGFLCAMPIFWICFRQNLVLFRDRDDLLFEMVGGVALALVMALLIAAIGAQTFYPREGVVPMWAALAVSLRVWVQRERLLAGEALFEDEDDSESWHSLELEAAGEPSMRG